MKEADILKDLLHFISSLQIKYNEDVVKIVNPEARQLFAQLRDDETRSIIKLQMKVERVQSKARVIARFLPAKTRN